MNCSLFSYCETCSVFVSEFSMGYFSVGRFGPFELLGVELIQGPSNGWYWICCGGDRIGSLKLVMGYIGFCCSMGSIKMLSLVTSVR